MPITRDQAFELAQDYVVTHRSEAFAPSHRVVDVDELRRERRREPAMYWVSKVSLEECWLVYCSGSDLPGLFSSTIVAVSKLTGEVVYAGSAHDEG
jgi:hypothetical protein